MTLQNQHIKLRALEPTDLNFVMQIENDTTQWILSNQTTPWSQFVLKQYLKNAHQDIYEAKQLRLVIENKNNHQAIGLVDLFDFDPKNKRVGLGITIIKNAQNQGFGTQVIELMIDYVFNTLMIHQIYVNILSDNHKSVYLFKKFGFKKVGVKKDWILHQNQWHDELLFQLINQ